MATSFKAYDTYAIFAEDSAFGTPGTPAGTSRLGKVQSITVNMANSIVRIQGIGEGRNATDWVNGGFDVNGSVTFQLTDASFLQYGFGAERAGSGTTADPYELQEVDTIGYSSGECPTITLEVGSEGGSGNTDDVLAVDGVAFNSMTINANVGEVVTTTMEFVGRSATSSTTKESYTAGTDRPFTFIDGSVTIGSDTLLQVSSAQITVNNNLNTYRSLGSRLIEQPVFGVRRYDFTLVVKKTADDGSGNASYQDLRSLFFNASTGTTPADVGQFSAGSIGTVSLDLAEGASSGDRVVHVDLENCQIESVSEPVDLGGGIIEVTVTGFGLAGLADSSVKVPLRFWTIT